MASLAFAIAIAVLVFVSGLIGLKLRALLPDEHGPDKARDMIGAMTGLIGLLLALVLGTLVGSSYTIYATQKSELDSMSAKVLQLDEALAAYGPEAAPGREGLRMAIQESYDKIWGSGDADFSTRALKALVAGAKGLDQFLLSLTPKTDAQRQLLTQASIAAGLINQTRLLMVFQLAASFSWPMLGIVVCWSALLFCGYGLISTGNRTTIAVLTLGALAVASAIFLILDLSQPYKGFFQIPSTSIAMLIDVMGGR